MAGFLNHLDVRLLEDGKTWKTLEAFDYDIGKIGGQKIIVPAGTLTDFGSVPQVLWSLISPIGKATRPFVLHDFLYKKQQFSRAFSDFILLEALGVVGEPWLKRRAIYYGVRSGGWIAWSAHKKANEAKKKK